MTTLIIEVPGGSVREAREAAEELCGGGSLRWAYIEGAWTAYPNTNGQPVRVYRGVYDLPGKLDLPAPVIHSR
jgi:hypothetical protein